MRLAPYCEISWSHSGFLRESKEFLQVRSWRDERILSLKLPPILLIILAALVAIPNLSIPPAKATGSSPWTFRDDFNYGSISQLQAAGWTTESIAPAPYYTMGNSILTLLNDGHVGAGAGYSNIPANVSDWSASTRVEWIGSSGNVSGYVGSYTEPDTTPGNTNLINIQALASWETNNNFDWMQANNSPSQPPPSPTYPYFTISTNPSAIALVAGQSANSTIRLQSQANFSG